MSAAVAALVAALGMHRPAADAADEERRKELSGVTGFPRQRMLCTPLGMQTGTATINDSVGQIPQPVTNHPQVLTLPGKYCVLGIPDELRAARAETRRRTYTPVGIVFSFLVWYMKLTVF